MPLKLAPSRPQQSAPAIGSAILLASGILLGSSTAYAQVITDAERHADALLPIIPAAMQAAPEALPAAEEPAAEADEAATPQATEPAQTPVSTPPPEPTVLAEPEQYEAPTSASDVTDAEVSIDESSAAQSALSESATGNVDGIAVDSNAQPTVAEALVTPSPIAKRSRPEKIDLREDKAMAPLQPVLPAMTRKPVADAGTLPPTSAAIADAPSQSAEKIRPAMPREAPMEVAEEAETPFVPVAEAIEATPPPAPTQAVSTAPVATPTPVVMPLAAPPTKTSATPLPVLPTPEVPQPPAPPAVAQGLRVYYASGNAQLSAREKQVVEDFCRKAANIQSKLIEVHVSLPSTEAVRLVALRQAELRSIFRAQGIGGESLRFRLAPYDSHSPGSPGAPLAPHYAEFRLIENFQ